jgi:hypothetical protein
MKPYPRKSLTQQQTSELKRPNPPTEAAIKRAQFVDKTYVWKSK